MDATNKRKSSPVTEQVSCYLEKKPKISMIAKAAAGVYIETPTAQDQQAIQNIVEQISLTIEDSNKVTAEPVDSKETQRTDSNESQM